MGRRSAVRSEDEPGHEDRTVAPPARATAADDVLALQQSAGNQAVSAMLAREPAEPAEAKAPEAAAATASLPDIGTIPLLSLNLDHDTLRGGGPGGGVDRPPGTPKQIVVTSRVGKHSALLQKALVSGAPMKVEIVMGGGKLKLTLEGALISSYSTSGGGEGGVESWSLNFTRITPERAGEQAEAGK